LELKVKIKFARQFTVLFMAVVFLLCHSALADDYSSTNFTVQDPVVTGGTDKSTSSSFNLGQSVSQVAIGKSTSTSFQLLSGFQYFFAASPNVLSASAGNGQVNLSWTLPALFNGAVVGSYEVGVGTTPGNYAYSNVGNITSYSALGLTNGVTYYFKVKAKTAGGITLVYSNESSATPSGITSNPGGGGGGGGGGYQTSTVVLIGQAAPLSRVVVLQNGANVGEMVSNGSGAFEITVLSLSLGPTNFSLYFLDKNGLRSDFVNVRVLVSVGEARVSGIYLPPTLGSDKLEVKKGDDITFLGFTIPNASVLLAAGSINQEAFSGSDGRYEIKLNTGNVPLGQQSVKTKAIRGNDSTPFSPQLKFLVGTENILTPETGACPAKADFNNDCRVDLVDFSILAYWYKKPNFPPEIDLNKDSAVDLVDFSILAYYWTL
jgi:hypothetical protein